MPLSDRRIAVARHLRDEPPPPFPCRRSSSSTAPIVPCCPCPSAGRRSSSSVYGVSGSALTPCPSAVRSRDALRATRSARL
ncbi:hypothetical protein STENM223S_06333 [Streptomyces tendae]